MRLPLGWNAVKLEGDWHCGQALIADLQRPRLAVRWSTPRRRRAFRPEAWAEDAMKREIGEAEVADAHPAALADERAWQGAMTYLDRTHPARDVFLAFSRASGRCIQVTHHPQRPRDRVLPQVILPSLADSEREQEIAWAVFDLSCATPPGFSLQSHRLNAGDLSLSFASGRRRLAIRQIALASLALERMPLDRWIAAHQRTDQKHYRPSPLVSDVQAAGLSGRSRRMVRRRRFAWMRWLPRDIVTWALNDARRDRLVIVQASDESLAGDAARSVGWAGAASEPSLG